MWPVWKIKLLVTTSRVVLWLYWSLRKTGDLHLFQQHPSVYAVVIATALRFWEVGCGVAEMCYVTGLLSGKSEQWLTAPVWKALGFSEKTTRKAMLNLTLSELKQSKKTQRKVKLCEQIKWMTLGFALRVFFKQDTPKWLTNLCLGRFQHSVALRLSSSCHLVTRTHTAQDRNTEWECKHWLTEQR